MKRVWLSLALLCVCLFALPAMAQNAGFNGFCYQGGVSAVVSGLNSTNKLQGIIPSCTVTVYLTGTTTKATLFSNAGGAPLANPFTANALGSAAPGQWLFFAAIGQGYDVVMSGGIAPLTYAQPVTLTDLQVPSGGGGGGGGTSVTVNGSSILPTANFNNTTPAAGTNGINITFQVSSPSVSAELVGDGVSTHFLNGLGAWATPAGSSFPSGTTNQLLYYASSGTTLTPLTLGTNLSITAGVLNASSTGATAFSALTTSTNTTATMTCGTGCSMVTSGSGSINASLLGGVALSGLCQTGGTGCPQLPVTKAVVSHNFLTSYTSTTGLFTAAQPAFTDIPGQASLAQLPTLSANTVLGALTATTPSGLTVPSCSGASNALTWTSGTGFGCNTITSGSTSFSALTTGTNTTATMNCGTGCTLAPSGTGTVTANNINGTITQGTNVTITGACTTVSPCVINASTSGGTGTVTDGAGTITAGIIPESTTTAHALDYNSLLDNGHTAASTLTYSGSGGITASAGPLKSGPPAGGVGSQIFLTQEGTLPSGLSATGQDNCYADSTQHGILCNFNAGSTLPLVQGPASDTSGHIASFTGANGGALADSGVVAANVLLGASLAAGVVHAPGSSQTMTSSLIVAADITNATITGAKLVNNTVTATQLAAQYSKGSCTEAWGGSGTSNVLQSGDDAVINNACYNDSGVTRTITAVKCRVDVASNTTTVNPTFGSAGTGTTILSGALTCGSSLAYSSSGTVTNASWTTGTGINPVMGGTLVGTSVAMIVEYTY